LVLISTSPASASSEEQQLHSALPLVILEDPGRQELQGVFQRAEASNAAFSHLVRVQDVAMDALLRRLAIHSRNGTDIVSDQSGPRVSSAGESSTGTCAVSSTSEAAMRPFRRSVRNSPSDVVQFPSSLPSVADDAADRQDLHEAWQRADASNAAFRQLVRDQDEAMDALHRKLATNQSCGISNPRDEQLS
jgi:hypothetical protein